MFLMFSLNNFIKPKGQFFFFFFLLFQANLPNSKVIFLCELRNKINKKQDFHYNRYAKLTAIREKEQKL